MKTLHKSSSYTSTDRRVDPILPLSVRQKLQTDYDKEVRSIVARTQQRFKTLLLDAGSKLRSLKKTS